MKPGKNSLQTIAIVGALAATVAPLDHIPAQVTLPIACGPITK